MTAKTNREFQDQDRKTQLARGYPNVPSGTTVKNVEEDTVNFCGGPWKRIEYGGNLYCVSPDGPEKAKP